MADRLTSLVRGTAALAALACMAPRPAAALEVLVMSNYGANTTAADFASRMTAAPVDLNFAYWDADTIPTAADLQQYDVIVLFENGLFSNASSVGGAVYDWYASGGRGLVIGMFYTQDRSDSTYSTIGWDDLETIDPLAAGSNGCDYNADSMDTSSIVPHFVTTGVSTIYAGSYRGDTEVANGATVLASWTTNNTVGGEDPVVAVNESFGSRVAGISIFPDYAAFGTYGSSYSGDFYTLFQNAIVWSGFGDCDDVDGDGEGDIACGGTDCDDTDPSINTGATEFCDDIDNDCDAVIDEDDAADADTWYADDDGDSYGDPGDTTASCDAPSGYVASAGDCDDDEPLAWAGAAEVCDDVDNDCDGTVDNDDAVDALTWYADDDGDGHGDPAERVTACELPTGFVAVADDCNDSAPLAWTGATEVCDGVDNDCDGTVDNDDAADALTFYADTDADGFGDATDATTACALPSGYSALSTDCDDDAASVNPAATEVCDAANTDEDCDGRADDADTSVSPATRSTFYADVDADGYGGSTTATTCDAPAGYLSTSTDCDDANAAIHPGATELTGDAVDQDCDGAESCFVDADEDGARTAFVVASSDLDCSDLGEALASAALDCDDTDPAALPGAEEVIGDEVDQDCDGGELCYVDADDDAYIADTTTVVSGDADCADLGEAPATALDGDCDDTDPRYNPASTEEACDDPADYNCDGSVGYVDADADGWAACRECDDDNAAVYPLATELPGDGLDSNCDGDELCYVDADADGYRADDTTIDGSLACDGLGEASVSVPLGDCDDSDASFSPAAVEGVGDEIDQNCDGGERCWTDADADGYRGDDGTVTTSADADCSDAPEAATATPDGDCDDLDASVSPASAETFADGIDQDCDGGDTCFADADLDGYTAADGSVVISTDLACDGAGEGAAIGADCVDTDAAIHPGATEIVGDAIDQDCDGLEWCYADVDGDGYTDETAVESADIACDADGELPSGASTGDCDDTDAAYNPGADESDCADPADYNCDGSTGYADTDGDGYAACEECDDADAAINPGADEVPGDGLDANCDGEESCYADADGDGARATTEVVSEDADCADEGEALVDAAEDCDDSDATTAPGAEEIVGNGVDNDCDGGELCYVDADADGYRPDGDPTVVSADALCADLGEAGSDSLGGDCDDADPAYNPGALEDDCTDPADYNCDGSSGYTDADGDGFPACAECDDGNVAVNPDGIEVCNGVDDDCDGTVDIDATDAVTWYADQDGDGFTDPDEAVTGCTPPEGYAAATEDDCDDADAGAYPGASEVTGDGIDQDCDGADSVGETGDTGTDDTAATDTGEGDDKYQGGGCNCATVPAPTAGFVGLVLLAFGLRRRRA